jgi:hypothetical protein
MSNDDILKAMQESGHLMIIPVGAPALTTKEIKALGVKMAKEGPRPLRVIAREILDDWGASKVWFGARPYLDAMLQLDSVNDAFYQDTARDMVAYFIGNAAKWTGPTATRVKAELRTMIGQKV